MACGGGLCGLASPAETIQRGFGGLGRWPPIKQQWHPRARGFGALVSLPCRGRFRGGLRAARECEATRPGKAPPSRGDRTPAPCAGSCIGGAVAEPQASKTKGSVRAGACPASTGGAGGQNGESCREEERGTQKA